MTLHVVYESSAGTTVDWAATDHVRLPGFEVTENAEEGTVAQSSLLVEDSGGALDIVGQKRWWAWESAESAGNQVIACGYVGDREIGRDVSGPEPFMVGADRRWSVNLVDKEEILSDRILTGPTADRPAETDIARLTWLLGSGFLPNVNDSLGYIDAIGAVDLSAANFSGQRAYDLISDCAQQSNKDFFLVKATENTTTGVATYSLWYAFDQEPAYTSALRLTNVRADIDNSVTFAVDPDLILRRTPERVYSGVLVRYLGGEVYQQDTTTGNAFRYRDAVHPGINVASASVASARAARYLADADAEEDRITCRFTVPKEKVNGLRAGQRVEFKFSHLPGYSTTDYQYARCVRRTVKQLSDEFYEIAVDLIPTPAGNATTTSARLMRPNDNNSDGTRGPETFRINWDNDGDNVQSGDATSPLVGLIEYVGVLGERTGLRVTGDGLVNIRLAFSVSVVADGSHSFIGFVKLNGTTIVSDTDFNGTPGLHVHAMEWGGASGTGTEITTSVVVREGDVIEAWVTTTEGAVGTHTTLPTGVGNGSHWLWVTGSLR